MQSPIPSQPVVCFTDNLGNYGGDFFVVVLWIIWDRDEFIESVPVDDAVQVKVTIQGVSSLGTDCSQCLAHDMCDPTLICQPFTNMSQYI
jgi:hypothetical protein